jgi:hypothetical protein
MDPRRDRSFDRKLELLVAARLRDGQAPETLLAELRTRLGDAEAEALMSRAEARASGPPNDQAARVLAWLAYGWTAVLVLQNVAIILNSAQSLDAASDFDRRTVFIPFTAFAVGKIVLLGAGAVAFHRWRSLAAACFYAVAILFAFPLGVILQGKLLFADYGIGVLFTVSAIASYAAALFVAVAYQRTRAVARPPIAVEAFD